MCVFECEYRLLAVLLFLLAAVTAAACAAVIFFPLIFSLENETRAR